MKPLKPVMAAILAASSFPFPLATPASAITPAGTTVNAGTTPDDAHVKALARDKEFFQRLISLIDAKPQVRADIGERLVKYIENRKDDRQYFTTALLDDKVQIKGIEEVARKWPEATAKKGGDAKSVAALYYILGTEAAPSWAPAGYEDEFKTDPTWSGRLAEGLATDKWNTTRKVDQSGSVNGTTAFLNAAANWALKVMEDPRTKVEVKNSVDANATTGVNPPTTNPIKANPLESSGSNFTFEDMYVKGAVVANVYSPNDDGYRTISMKVYTMKADDGTMINRVGIVDITKPDIGSPSPTQWIDASSAGDTEVTFRDGGRPYTVTVNSDGSITMKRKGAGDGGGQLTTSKDDLSTKRDDQIATGGTVTIGGQPYYVLAQGGQKGSYLFFNQAQIDDLRARRAAGQHPNMNAHPDLMGDVLTASNDGPVAAKGKPDLGALQGGAAYHLEFDPDLKMWKVMPGKGDPATPPPAGSTTTATTTTTTDAGTVVPPTTAPANLQEAIQQATADKQDKTKVWVEDEGNQGFDQASRAVIRIMSNQRVTDGMTHFKVLFDASLGVKGDPASGHPANEFEFQAMNKDVRLLHIRGVKNFVALEYGTGTQYYDLQNFANYVQHVFDSSLSYSQAGSYAGSNGQMQDVISVDIMADILTHYMKVKPDDPTIKTIRERVALHAKGKGYVLNGDLKALIMGSGEEGRTIWPNDIASGDTGNNDKLTDLRGPGTAVQVTGGGTGEFLKEMDITPGHAATRVKMENHAALYASEEEENSGGKNPTVKTVKVWSVMLEYKNDNGLPSRSKALPVFGTGKNRYQMPSTLHMQGLPDVQLPASTQLVMLYGSNQENGAIAAYRTTVPDKQGASNVKDKKGNCGGPVLWWGSVTKEQVQAACESDSSLK